MSGRVCLVTTEHVSRNPRVVKEADALHDAGFEVRVVACQWDELAARHDSILMSGREWRLDPVRWGRRSSPGLFWFSRARHRVARGLNGPLWELPGLAERAVERVTPELTRAAAAKPADLYVGHELGGLAAAAAAAWVYRAALGFDAEDFHSGMDPGPVPGRRGSLASFLEGRYLPRCDYVTAASPGIARAYSHRYGIPRPTTILNVFPLAQRPDHLRFRLDGKPLSLYWFSKTIGPKRGLEDVVDAMGRLRTRDVVLHLRGERQDEYRERLGRRAAEAGLVPEQIVVHGLEPSEEMVRLSALHDVGLALEQPVSENRDLCVTNKVFTYLLAGNAVVATETRGQSDVMSRARGAGFLYRVGDVAALTEGLRRWLDDREALGRARQAAWEWGTRRYNWDLEKRRFLRTIERIFEVRRQGGAWPSR